MKPRIEEYYNYENHKEDNKIGDDGKPGEKAKAVNDLENKIKELDKAKKELGEQEDQFYNNKDTGLQLGRGYSNETHIDEWPSYNLIKNCTSFANYDDETLGENADGFAAKLTVGVGNV